MFYSRKSTRIPRYDYSNRNYYFLTLCTNNRKCILGQPERLNNLGKIVEKHILNIPEYYQNVFIDKYVVMPNHIHMILVLNGDNNPNISLIMAQFKRGVTMEIRKTLPNLSVWQRSFHDHVIRDQKDYERIWLYIDANPMNWGKDCFYVNETEISSQMYLG